MGRGDFTHFEFAHLHPAVLAPGGGRPEAGAIHLTRKLIVVRWVRRSGSDSRRQRAALRRER